MMILDGIRNRMIKNGVKYFDFLNYKHTQFKKTFHKLITKLFNKLKYHIQKNFNMRLDYEYNDKEMIMQK